ncbi:MAG: SGNH/GDSL hydrolase family protein [Acidobacteriota bacterium]
MRPFDSNTDEWKHSNVKGRGSASSEGKVGLRGKRKILFSISAVILALIAAFGIAEVIARLSGESPWVRPVASNAKIEPGGRFYAAHPSLGYTHLAGRFQVTLGTGYSFTITNGPDTLRATHPTDQIVSEEEMKAGIWIFGCSVTEGWSVNDEETYPWLVQEGFPDSDVVNFGVCGYGSLQSLIQFREALKAKAKPKVAVLAYAGFHDERNTAPRNWRKAMAVANNENGLFLLPRARLEGGERLQVDMSEFTYREFPGMRYFALIHSLEKLYNSYEEGSRNNAEVAREILKQFAAVCAENDILFICAGISGDRSTSSMLNYCRQQGMLTADISVDHKSAEYNNLPHDSHPNAKAHREYAKALSAVLKPFLQSQQMKK